MTKEHSVVHTPSEWECVCGGDRGVFTFTVKLVKGGVDEFMSFHLYTLTVKHRGIMLWVIMGWTGFINLEQTEMF